MSLIRIVGKAACTGNDYWISSQDTSTIQFKYNEPLEVSVLKTTYQQFINKRNLSSLEIIRDGSLILYNILQFPGEWIPQFMAGFKVSLFLVFLHRLLGGSFALLIE